MRPRKVPPVHVPDGHKYCFGCRSLLTLAAFSADARQWDGKRLVCRTCDMQARDQRRRAFRNTVLASRWAVRQPLPQPKTPAIPG